MMLSLSAMPVLGCRTLCVCLYRCGPATPCKSFCGAAVTAVVLASLIAPAGAAEEKEADVTATTPNAVQLECFKQYGAYQSPQTGTWTMTGPPYAMAAAVEAVYRCVAQRTGRPVAPFLHQNIYYR
jgi:hypothetical protein